MEHKTGGLDEMYRDAERRAEEDLRIARTSDLWEQAVKWARRELGESGTELIRSLHAEDPDGWMIGRHFTSGIRFRNALRHAGYGEDAFGIGNLDNVYVEILEEAAGVEG